MLINNAGAYFLKRMESVDGIEMTFALNHLACFLLTNLLLDRLLASAPARIIVVSSVMQAQGQINFDDLEGKRRYSGLVAYAQSKLANVLFTDELARRLQGTGVTVNALNPGLVASNFTSNNALPLIWWKLFARLFGVSPTKGAQTSIYLAASPKVADVTGQYFERQQAVCSSPASYEARTAAHLWDVSE